MIGGITLILLCLVMGWLVLISGIEYRRYIKQELLLEKVAKLEAEKEELKKPKSIGDEMTMEQVNAMIADFEFWEMVQKCVETGLEYNSIKECANALGIKSQNIYAIICGKHKYCKIDGKSYSFKLI